MAFEEGVAINPTQLRWGLNDYRQQTYQTNFYEMTRFPCLVKLSDNPYVNYPFGMVHIPFRSSGRRR